MAFYRHPELLTQFYHDHFETIFEPTQSTPWSGIFRCEGCGKEIVHVSEKPLPGWDDHKHSFQQGWIRWRLIVAGGGSFADA